MKLHFDDINKFDIYNNTYEGYIEDSPIKKQIENIERGNKIIIDSEEENQKWVNKPLTFMKFDDKNLMLYAFDDDSNIFRINTIKNNNFNIRLL